MSPEHPGLHLICAVATASPGPGYGLQPLQLTYRLLHQAVWYHSHPTPTPGNGELYSSPEGQTPHHSHRTDERTEAVTISWHPSLPSVGISFPFSLRPSKPTLGGPMTYI